jgi:hypothetical protein
MRYLTESTKCWVSFLNPTYTGYNTARLRKIVGWVEALRNPTKPPNLGFRSSTQPTRVKVFGLNRVVLTRVKVFGQNLRSIGATLSLGIGQNYHLHNENGKPSTKDELADNCRHDGMW